jgi:phage terminase small subunit
MAGVKGRSGGPRPNSGGDRPGAGRPPKPPAPPVVIDGDVDMLKLLQDVALGRIDASPIQVRAAIAAVQYTHTKRADGGKKEEQQEAAKKVAGRFSASAPPKLVAAGGKNL